MTATQQVVHNHLVKILMIGGGFFNKTKKGSYINKYLNGADSFLVDDFDEIDEYINFKSKLKDLNISSTSLSSYSSKSLSTKLKAENKDIVNKIKFQIKDLCDNYCSLKLKNISSCWFRGIHGFILVYDINDKISYDNIKIWINEIKLNSSKTSQIIILCNNSTPTGIIDPITAKEYFESISIPHFIVSVETNENINLALKSLQKLIFEKNPLFQNFKIQQPWWAPQIQQQDTQINNIINLNNSSEIKKNNNLDKIKNNINNNDDNKKIKTRCNLM